MGGIAEACFVLVCRLFPARASNVCKEPFAKLVISRGVNSSVSLSPGRLLFARLGLQKLG